MSSIIDISVPIRDQMTSWPGDPPVRVEKTLDLACGHPATVSQFQMGSHTGTHVDAFSHFLAQGETLSQMPLDPYLGPALVVEIEDPEKITLGELQRNPAFLDLRKARRVLFKTINSQIEWYLQPFNEHFCHLNPHAADFLIELGVQLVGIDYLSVEAYHAESLYGEKAPTHHRLMQAGVYILEGLNLHGIKAGWYDLICLPMAVQYGDGAPARAILRPFHHS